MPSRKKAKGKARKAAKEAKAAKEEESQALVEVAASQRQGESVETQLQRLRINAASPKLCRHGLVQSSPGDQKICEDFINTFAVAFRSSIVDLGDCLHAAYNTTKEKYPDVYASKLDTVVSILLARGTQYILEEVKLAAVLHAVFASYFEGIMAIEVDGSEDVSCLRKIVELFNPDDHTLVSYYRNRTPCSCLDEKYKEVKSVKKMGLCCNTNCSQPGCRVERSKMFSCTRCGAANYCSVQCQRADWKKHKKICTIIVEKKKEAMKSNQT